MSATCARKRGVEGFDRSIPISRFHSGVGKRQHKRGVLSAFCAQLGERRLTLALAASVEQVPGEHLTRDLHVLAAEFDGAALDPNSKREVLALRSGLGKAVIQTPKLEVGRRRDCPEFL